MDLAESMREKVARRMRQVPVLEVSSSDEGSAEDEELITSHTKKKPLKSGKLRTANSPVLHHVMWLHQLVNTAEVQPAVYDNISVPLLLAGT